MDESAPCAYCASAVLTGDEKPEHPIPAALGSSLKVFTVCKVCNDWAGTHIDQPWLADQSLRERRSFLDQRDPRRRQKRRVPSSLLSGHSEEGDYFSYDHDAQRPVMGSRIVELGDGRYQIRAGSMEEATRLMERMRERARADGQDIEVTATEHRRIQPEIKSNVSMSTIAWRRAAGKIGLGVASQVFPPEWRITEDAHRLREWMHNRDPRTDDETAPPLIPSDAGQLGSLASGDAHRLWFTRLSDGWVYLSVVLFGSLYFAVPVSSDEGAPVPQDAWILDWRYPRRDGRTTWERMLIAACS